MSVSEIMCLLFLYVEHLFFVQFDEVFKFYLFLIKCLVTDCLRILQVLFFLWRLKIQYGHHHMSLVNIKPSPQWGKCLKRKIFPAF
jgi:hypothetical protein